MTTECESTRGKWSTPEAPSVCPDCGAVMPTAKQPLRSWMSSREVDLIRSERGKLGGTPRVWKQQDREAAAKRASA